MLIQKMRDQSQGILAKIIVGAIIVVFAMFGFGSITTFLIPKPWVASVNGDDITQQEMSLAVERKRQVIRANSGSDALNVDEEQLAATTLNELIERKLLSQEADDLDLYYSEARLDQDIVNTPAFQVDGKFDEQRFQLMLRGVGYTPQSYRDAIRSELMFAQIQSGIAGTSFMTDEEVRRYVSLAQQTRDIAWLRIEVADLKDPSAVTDEEVAAYYQDHQEAFYTEEEVNLQYLELQKSEIAKQVTYDDSELKSRYEEEKNTYATAEERDYAHILIEVNDKRPDEEAQKLAQSLHDRIVAGASFGDLAREYSDDPGSREKGGDLGFTQTGAFVPEFEAAGAELSVGQVSEPVKTEFGYHVIKLLGVNAAKIPTFDELRDRLDQEIRMSKAEEIFVEKSARLGELSYESADLSMPSEELDLPIKETGFFSRTNGSGLTAQRSVIDAAFSEDLLVDHNNSDVIEVEPDHDVVIRVKEHHPSKLRPLAEVSGEVRETLAIERARERAKEEADEILALLEGGSITRFVADKYGLEWAVKEEITRNEKDLDPQITKAAFELPRPPEGEKSLGSAVMPNGDAVVISVTRITNGPTTTLKDEDLRNLGQYLAAQQGQDDYSEYRDGLRARADIEKKQ